MNIYQLYFGINWFDYGYVTDQTITRVRAQADMLEKLLAEGWKLRFCEQAEEDVYYDLFGKFADHQAALDSLRRCNVQEFDLEELSQNVVKVVEA